MTDPLTLKQAADQLGMSPAALRVQVNRGVLKARRLGPINVVDQEEIERYRAEHRRRPGGMSAPSRDRPARPGTPTERIDR